MTVFQTGGAPYTADTTNNLVQTYDNVAQLRGQIGTVTGPGVTQGVYLKGYNTPGDGGQGQFWWNATSTAVDDGGVTTVVPSGSSLGAWIRVSTITTVTGAFVAQTVVSGAPAVNLGSIILPVAGGWLINGAVQVNVATGATVNSMFGSLSTSAGALQGALGTLLAVTLLGAPGAGAALPTPSLFLPSVTVGQQIYFFGAITWTGSPTPTITPYITAIRIAPW